MMQNRQSIYNVKNALVTEIAAALNVSSIALEIEISEVNTDDTYSVTGSFKVVTFWSSNIPTKRGKFTAILDENLKIINLKITEETASK
jgi:hypothetical protein